MKYLSRFVCLFCFMALSLINSNAQNTFIKPKVYAVIIGVADYQDPDIPSLKYAEKDAKAFYDFLKSPGAGSVPDEQIAFLSGTRATRGNILTEMIDLYKRATPEDLIIFYFSGHAVGDSNEDPTAYFLTYDSRIEQKVSTGMSMEEINSKIARYKAKMKVSYIDACHAGMFIKENGKGLPQDNSALLEAYDISLQKAGEGIVSFMASSKKQQSTENEKLQHGVFTYYLLKGLKGEADLEHKGTSDYMDGKVTVSELNTYLNAKVTAATKYNQTPQMDLRGDEKFPLSILRSDVVLSEEISKRPSTKATSNTNQVAQSKASDKKMTDALTFSNGSCYGQFTFINELKEPLLLYFIKSWNNMEPNQMIPIGDNSTTPRQKVAWTSNLADCSGQTQDITFFFKTLEENGPVRYGYIKNTSEAGINKGINLNKSTLYLSKTVPNNY